MKGEKKLGLSRNLYIQCNFCLALNRMTHIKKREEDIGMPSFSINTKVGAGMLLYSLINRMCYVWTKGDNIIKKTTKKHSLIVAMIDSVGAPRG